MQFVLTDVVTLPHKVFFTQQFITNILFCCTVIDFTSPLSGSLGCRFLLSQVVL